MGASREAFGNSIQFTPELCRGVDHFHLASLFVLPRLRAEGPQPLIQARAAGLTTSFDTNWDPQGGWMGTLAPCLPHIDVLFMNEEEARMVTGSVVPSEIAKAVLGGGLRTLALKMGGKGCAIYTQEREILCPAFEVIAKDTTGAGDCFAAGFLTAMLDGASLPEAGRFANAVGALSVQKTGATTGVVGRLETERWMSRTPIRVR
jgi:sugar/nucleoside kinase (ribokinase family)